MITRSVAFAHLKRLTSGGPTVGGVLADARTWVRFADEALAAGDIYTARACLAVVEKLLEK